MNNFCVYKINDISYCKCFFESDLEVQFLLYVLFTLFKCSKNVFKMFVLEAKL